MTVTMTMTEPSSNSLHVGMFTIIVAQLPFVLSRIRDNLHTNTKLHSQTRRRRREFVVDGQQTGSSPPFGDH